LPVGTPKPTIKWIKIAADIKTNIEIGSILIREVNAADEHRSDDYRVVYITVDGKAILVCRGQSNESAVVDSGVLASMISLKCGSR
jgi:hypothetical protein